MERLVTKAEEINNVRSNIINILMRLYKQLEDKHEEIHLPYEKFILHFVPGKGLWIDGCIDRVSVKDYRYASVSLGHKITSYHHLPYNWLQGLIEGDIH